jgi:hypothetical protein
MDVIKFPKYVNNYLSLWSVYEKSYIDKNYLYDYKINNNNENNYVKEYDKIIKLKNNFYKIDNNKVFLVLFKKLNNLFIDKYNDIFRENIINFIKTENINKLVYCFLKTLAYDEDRVLLLVNEFKEDNFINNVKKIDQIILEIKKIENMDGVINLIYMKVSNNISKKFINFINNVDLDILSNLLKKINLFKKFYEKFDLNSKSDLNTTILNKIIKSLNNNSISNINLANNIIILFNFLKSDSTLILYDLDFSLLLDYMCASIYYWILDNNFSNIETLILYSSSNFPKLDFLEYYKIHLQNRALFLRNYELENKCFSEILEYFKFEECDRIIYDIKYILDDLNLSNLCNNEFKNLNVESNYKFKNIKFELNKCNILIGSNSLWNNNYNLYNSINYVENIDVYKCILNKFYESKYSKKRKLNISFEESTININLFKNNIIMPLSYYNLFYKIGETSIENSKNTFNYLKKTLNYNEDYLLKIINILKSKNLLKDLLIINRDKLNNYINKYYKNNDFSNLKKLSSNYESFFSLDYLCNIFFEYIKTNNLEVTNNIYKIDDILLNLLNISEDIIYVINSDLENQELRLDLTNIVKTDKKVLEKFNYDKNLLLDSNISKLLKIEKKLKYGKLLLLLRNKISKFFIPSEKEILNRLERLEVLGYIENENSFYKYIE